MTILTRANGTPYDKPERAEFPVGTDGDLAFLRASRAYRDEVASDANRAFDAQLRESLTRRTEGRS